MTFQIASQMKLLFLTRIVFSILSKSLSCVFNPEKNQCLKRPFDNPESSAEPCREAEAYRSLQKLALLLQRF